jgi:hypothetical protein
MGRGEKYSSPSLSLFKMLNGTGMGGRANSAECICVRSEVRKKRRGTSQLGGGIFNGGIFNGILGETKHKGLHYISDEKP